MNNKKSNAISLVILIATLITGVILEIYDTKPIKREIESFYEPELNDDILEEDVHFSYSRYRRLIVDDKYIFSKGMKDCSWYSGNSHFPRLLKDADGIRKRAGNDTIYLTWAGSDYMWFVYDFEQDEVGFWD